MPYIKQKDRAKFEFVLSNFNRVIAQEPINAGDMNYLITKMIHGYLKEKGLNYQHINDVIGVLECAKLELYDRKVRDYENLKIKENGDVE